MSAQKVLVTPTFTAKPPHGGTVALVPGDTQHFFPIAYVEEWSQDYRYRFYPADGWRFSHLEVSYDISTTYWADGVIVDDGTETLSDYYYSPGTYPYFDFDSDGQFADTAAHGGEAFSSMKPYWWEQIIVNPGSTPERQVDVQQKSRIAVTAVFVRDPTHLLIHDDRASGSNLLVYDDRPGGTGLLVADY